jgi:predicted dehydrogenase
VLATETSEPIRWAIVGTGPISHQFAPDVGRTGNSVLTSIVSRDRQKGSDFAHMHGAQRSHDDYLTFLSSDDADVIYIATPQGTHHDLAVAAIKAGKNVVVEKPIAMNAAQVSDLRARAKGAGTFLMEAMWMKFSPAYKTVLSLIASGQIGDVRSVRASFGANFPRGTGSRWNDELGGSALLDQGIYTVTLAQALLGNPDRITAVGDFVAPSLDSSEWMTFNYDNGRHAQLSSSMVQWIDPSASINGTDGYLRLDAPFWATSRIHIHKGTPEEILFDSTDIVLDIEGNGFVPMIRSVSDAIGKGFTENPAHSLAATLDTFRILDRVRGQIHLPR